MSCNARRCRKAPSLAAASSKWGAKAPPTMFSALAMRPGGTAATSAAARPMLQLARKFFDDSIIARPWRKPATRWLASEGDALRRKPDHRHRRLLRARRERPSCRRAAGEGDERAPLHSIKQSVIHAASFWEHSGVPQYVHDRGHFRAECFFDRFHLNGS